jgi:hypothetical protein
MEYVTRLAETGSNDGEKHQRLPFTRSQFRSHLRELVWTLPALLDIASQRAVAQVLSKDARCSFGLDFTVEAHD